MFSTNAFERGSRTTLHSRQRRERTSQRLEMAGLNHLPDLLAVVVALNEKEIRRLLFL